MNGDLPEFDYILDEADRPRIQSTREAELRRIQKEEALKNAQEEASPQPEVPEQQKTQKEQSNEGK